MSKGHACIAESISASLLKHKLLATRAMLTLALCLADAAAVRLMPRLCEAAVPLALVHGKSGATGCHKAGIGSRYRLTWPCNRLLCLHGLLDNAPITTRAMLTISLCTADATAMCLVPRFGKAASPLTLVHADCGARGQGDRGGGSKFLGYSPRLPSCRLLCLQR